MNFQEDVVLAPYTTFRVGGPARWFAEAGTEEDLAAGVAFARERGAPLFVLGGGSNLLISDFGFPGLALRVAVKGIDRESRGGRAIFSVGAGENWDAFVARAVAEDCAGVECLSGIPGTVGGTPVQNVGAYGQEVSETITRVRVLDRRSSAFRFLENSECGFHYRQSIFNTTERERYIVCRVEFSLAEHGRPAIRYEELRRALDGGAPTLGEVREQVRAIRARKGMLCDPGLGGANLCSAGSFFRNPVIPAAHLERVASAAGVPVASVPHYPAGNRAVKLPAAWLLERTGFQKGYVLGNAGLSSLHALALINRGGATSAEIVALRDKIVRAVEDKFGIPLEPEPVWVG